ncbi:MAG TPA: beta-ketoacyl synthase N-terminal-like domain-containing protein, partial [Bacillota bacterium]|nr:beta-ketoacyl synthase N-terminal-like domain-containing protein [Bacillota bacterium]
MLKINIKELANSITDSNVIEIEGINNKDIAIIGMSVKLPLAENLDQFWDNLKEGRDCITDLPPGRKVEADAYLKYSRNKAGVVKYKKGSYLEKIDEFDCQFFNISPREASLMDPNQRMFLEIAYRAIEDAGYGGVKLKGSQTGVYCGFVSDLAYQRFIGEVEPASIGISIPGNMAAVIPGRVSYTLDLRGPNVLIDTACSSSLVALHTACAALRNGDCDQAVVGTVKINLLPLEDGNMLGIESKNYICKAFDADSDGTCMGEGVMALVLKPLAQAVKAQDHVYAVIKGTAINQDGRSIGITAPNALAQAEVIEKAWKDAGIIPETITYIETHGTGTTLGDPVEIDGISRAFSKYTEKKQFCAIGSVKTNLGHLDSAAGMVGLIKAVLSLQHKQIPPSLHFQKPNPNIDFSNSPVFVNVSLADWESDGPRRCGVSAFGLSGANSHIILEEAPPGAQRKVPLNFPPVLTLSAKSREALRSLCGAYLKFLEQASNIDLCALCYTANTGRGHYNYRLAIIAETPENLIRELEFASKLELVRIPEIASLDENAVYYGEFKLVPNADSEAESELSDSEQKRISGDGARKMKEFKTTQDPTLLREICSLYVKGADLNWDELYDAGGYQKISLPVYPFMRKRCWLEIPAELGQGKEELDWDNGAHVRMAIQAQDTVILTGRQNQEYSELELQVAQVWGRALGFENIGVTDDFYQLGGDSILAMKIVNEINQQMKARVDIKDLLQHLTIGGFADYLAGKLAAGIDATGDRQTDIYNQLKPIEAQEYYPTGYYPDGYYPTSSAQRRIFFLNKFEGLRTSYNIPGVIKIKGKLDPEKLDQSFRILVGRHESLRTSFALIAGKPAQRIHQEVEFKLRHSNYDGTPIRELIEQFIQPFDLNKAPLLRVELVSMSEDEHLLFIDMSHNISDGTSLGVLVREIISLYEGKKLSELPLQYKDFSAWQDALMKSEVIKRQEEYWLEVFREEVSVLSLPLDYPRPPVKSYEGNTITFEVGRELSAGLSKLAAKLSVSLNMMVLAVFNTLLS